MIKVELQERTNIAKIEPQSINASSNIDCVNIKCEKITNCATFNIMQSSEISKVLRELTQCVASEQDLLVPEGIDIQWDSVPRNDISCSEVSGSTTTNGSLELLCSDGRAGQTHVCGDCGKHFSKRDFLQKHKIVHEEPRHRCVICDKSFVREDKLKRHFVSIHSKHRPHVCTICAKAFARKDKLKDHQKHHLTACDNFMCLDCRIPFVQKSDLNRHTRAAHSGSSGNNQKSEEGPISVVTDISSPPTSLTMVTSVITQIPKTRSRRVSKPLPRRSQILDNLIPNSQSSSCPPVSQFLSPSIYDNHVSMYSSSHCPTSLSSLLHSSSSNSTSPYCPLSNYPLEAPQMISTVLSISSDDKHLPLKTSFHRDNHTGSMLLAAATHHNICQFQQHTQLRYYHPYLHHQHLQSQQPLLPFNGHNHHQQQQQQHQQQLTTNIYPYMPF